MALLVALVISFAIMAVWQDLEYRQFGELQQNRQCDNVVAILYFLVIWFLLAKIGV